MFLSLIDTKYYNCVNNLVQANFNFNYEKLTKKTEKAKKVTQQSVRFSKKSVDNH